MAGILGLAHEWAELLLTISLISTLKVNIEHTTHEKPSILIKLNLVTVYSETVTIRLK